MTDKELCERLRSGRWLGETTGKPAADRIEALTAEVARLKALLDERDKFIVAHDLWGAFTDALGDEA